MLVPVGEASDLLQKRILIQVEGWGGGGAFSTIAEKVFGVGASGGRALGIIHRKV